MHKLDDVAQMIHETWRAKCRAEGWPMQPHLDRPYEEIADSDKEENRAAARGMAEVLAAVRLMFVDADRGQDVSTPMLEALLEEMAKAEHALWTARHASDGWAYGPVRDEASKKHPSMIAYDQLPEAEKEKGRNNVRHYPDFAALAGLKIVRRP